MMQLQDADFVITSEGYELNQITKDSVIEYDQNKALKMPTLSILKLEQLCRVRTNHK
jgi:hypothetical protein